MTDDQILAWLTLEGYQAWNWTDALKRDGAPLTIYRPGDVWGVVVDFSGGVHANPTYPDEETAFPLTTVSTEDLRKVFAFIQRERDKEEP